MKVKSESEVAQLCLTLSDSMDYTIAYQAPPSMGFSITHKIFRSLVCYSLIHSMLKINHCPSMIMLLWLLKKILVFLRGAY